MPVGYAGGFDVGCERKKIKRKSKVFGPSSWKDEVGCFMR